MVEPGPFDMRQAISERHSSLNRAIAAVLFAALAIGVIVMAGTPGLARQERAYQAERV